MKTIDGELKLDYLKGTILTGLEFTFYESGILVSGNYMRELFLAFADKPKNWGVVAIVSRNVMIANPIIYSNDINEDLNLPINANNMSLANNPKVKLSGLVFS